jgi:KDO2-lipid IV(A) lauroyltransferase
MTRRAVWLLEAVLFFIVSIPLAILPIQLSKKVGEILGLFLFHIWGSRRRIAIENLETTVASGAITISEPAEKIIKDNFKNLGRSFAEIIKIYYGMGRKIIDSVDIEGIENFNQAKSKGKGILFLTGHCGNWELMSISASVKLFPISIIARPINNPYINKLIENARQRYGNTVIYKQKAIKTVMRILKINGIIGILMDQAVIPDEGFVIDFLGRGAWTTKMPALLARKTEAAVLPAFINRTNGGHKIKIYPEIELSKIDDLEKAAIEDTKIFSSYIEKYIREHPKEWLWIHRRWKRVS